MEDAATGIRLWLRSRAHGHDSLRWPADALRIRHDEARLVRRVGLEIEDAAREHVRRDDVHARLGVDPLALEPQQRQRRLPLARARLPERHLHARVAIGVALDEPLESEVDERGRLDEQLARRHHLRRRSVRRRRRPLCLHAAKQSTRTTAHEQTQTQSSIHAAFLSCSFHEDFLAWRSSKRSVSVDFAGEKCDAAARTYGRSCRVAYSV